MLVIGECVDIDDVSLCIKLVILFVVLVLFVVAVNVNDNNGGDDVNNVVAGVFVVTNDSDELIGVVFDIETNEAGDTFDDIGVVDEFLVIIKVVGTGTVDIDDAICGNVIVDPGAVIFIDINSVGVVIPIGIESDNEAANVPDDDDIAAFDLLIADAVEMAVVLDAIAEDEDAIVTRDAVDAFDVVRIFDNDAFLIFISLPTPLVTVATKKFLVFSAPDRLSLAVLTGALKLMMFVFMLPC